MTIQTVSLAADLLMLLTAAIVVCLAGAAAVQAARARWAPSARLAGAAGAVAVLYGAALVGAGLSSRPQQLVPGDAKCFDDWCAAMVGVRGDAAAGRLLVDVRIQNRGRGRAMRSSLARAYLEGLRHEETAPEDGSGLRRLLQPGERAEVELVFAAPRSLRGVRLVVVEGTGGLGPGTFEVGGESSPFHARAGWPLERQPAPT